MAANTAQENGDNPGWGEMLASVFRAPFEERLARQEAARTERLLLETQSQMLGEAVRRVQPDNDEFTIPVGHGEGAETRELDAATASTLRKAARRAARTSTHIRGYLRTLERFVMGRGVDISPEIESEEVLEDINSWWEKVKKHNNWDQLEGEIPARTWRDGETFIWFVEHEEDVIEVELDRDVERHLTSLGVDTDGLKEVDIPAGMLAIRLLPPEQINDPEGIVSHGVITAKGDVQNVLGYIWSPDGREVEEVISSKEMIHLKINVDSDAKRGRSQVEPILKRNAQYEKWLESRITLNFVRSAVALIRKVEGTQAQFASVVDKYKSTEREPSVKNKQKMLKPGSTVSEGPGVTWRFESPNLQASDAQKDGRSILLTMAAATGMPEFIFTGDSQNMNMATALVAESPGVREFEDWQDYFSDPFEEIYRRAILAGVRAEQISGITEEEVMEMSVTTDFPPMVAREEKQHTEANQIRHQNKILSREGWARDEGIDWDVEKDRLKNERAEGLEMGEEYVPGSWPHGHDPDATGDTGQGAGEGDGGDGSQSEPEPLHEGGAS